MSFDLQLSGLRAVVTGGTLGLGAAVVKTLVGMTSITYSVDVE